MRALRAIICAFACFSAVPMPMPLWDDRGMRWMMAAFPLVGVLIGGLWRLWGSACDAVAFGQMLRGVGYALIPALVTGGIHLDGLADVIDAQSSHASPERKREILKDPHVGAFAIIGICGYLMAFAALASEVDASQIPAMACIPVISRCLSGFATVTLRTSGNTGMLASEQSSADAGLVRVVLGIVWLASSITMGLVGPAAAVLATIASLAVCLSVWRLAMTQFGGMSGDLAGYLLQMVELAMLAMLVIAGRLW